MGVKFQMKCKKLYTWLKSGLKNQYSYHIHIDIEYESFNLKNCSPKKEKNENQYGS